jgi:hypothetical protein
MSLVDMIKVQAKKGRYIFRENILSYLGNGRKTLLYRASLQGARCKPRLVGGVKAC